VDDRALFDHTNLPFREEAFEFLLGLQVALTVVRSRSQDSSAGSEWVNVGPGAILMSALQRENLPLAMITGRKRRRGSG
jgi:hypothetical protein